MNADRAVHAAARHGPAALAAWGAATVAAALLPAWPLRLAAVAADLAVVACCIALLAHGRRLCQHCVGFLPADPDAAVAGHRAALAWWHHPHRALHAWACAAAAVVPTVLGGRWGGLLAGAAMTAVAVQVHADRWHRDLLPWCPWCRHGGDNRSPSEPDPKLWEAR